MPGKSPFAYVALQRGRNSGSAPRPAHSGLLAGGIPIVEHLTGLDALPPAGFRFHAVHAPVVGMGTFPVRAYAVIDT